MNNYQQGQFWRCKGDENNCHQELVHSWDTTKCKCGKSRPRNSSQPITNIPTLEDVYAEPVASNFPNLLLSLPPDSISSIVRPKKKAKKKVDKGLFIPLSILNIVSGFTTVQGAAQILPQLIAYPAGLSVQVILFILVSSSDRLQDHLIIKRLVIGIFSVMSVYTSFFSYYGLLTDNKRLQSAASKAITAHQNLVSDVFTPIESKATKLQNEIKDLDKRIEAEKNGKRASGKTKCGPECIKLVKEKESLETSYNKTAPIVDRLKPLFTYDLNGKNSETIFLEDINAIKSVEPNCLQTEPKFNCIPDKYRKSLSPNSSEYQSLRETYVDESTALSRPLEQLMTGKMDGTMAIILALMVDGSILLLGKGIETKRTAKKLSLTITGDGFSFIEDLSPLITTIDLGRVIDLSSAKDPINHRAYVDLLRSISTEKRWLERSDNPSQKENIWHFTEDLAERLFTLWFNEEKERQLKQAKREKTIGKIFPIEQSVANKKQQISIQLPDLDD